MESKLWVSSSPHIRSEETISTVMRDVVIALVPATAFSIYLFGFNAVKTILLSVIAAMLTEYIVQKIRNKPITLNDFSAVITGLLLAFNLPASVPWWIPVIGSIFAIAVVKQAFGGLGQNFMNPALGARAMLVASWPVEMTSWIAPGPDAVSAATPLGIIKESGVFSSEILSEVPTLWTVIKGTIGGSLGETSALLLILGGMYLVYRGVIKVRIPGIYIGTFGLLTLAYTGFDFQFTIYQLFTGGLMLGAIYMATDYASSPVTKKGEMIFAFGAGVLTFIIRFFGGLPEGVSYSILLMNVATPIIERYTTPTVFGGGK